MKKSVRVIDCIIPNVSVAAILSLALTGCSTILETPEIRANELAQAAAQAVRANKFSDAEKLYTDAVAEAQKSNNLLQVANRLDDLADVYRQDGRKELQAATLRRAIDEYKLTDKEKLRSYDSLLIHQLLSKDLTASANLECELGNFNNAEQLFKQALSTNEKDTEDWDSHTRIMKDYASLLHKMHRDAEADKIEVALSGNDLDAADWDRMFSAINDYYYKGDKFDPAKEKSINHDLDVLRESIRQFKGRSARTHYSLGLRELALRHPVEAENEFRQCVDLFQKIDFKTGGAKDSVWKPIFLSDALSMLALSLELQGKTQEAETLDRKALTYNRETPIGRLMTMTNMYRVRDPKQLDKLTARILKLVQSQPDPLPSDVNTLISLGTLHHTLGEKSQEQTCFSEAVRLESRIKKQPLSDKAYFYTFFADQLVGSGRDGEAEKYYQQGIALCRKEKLSKAWACSACLSHYADLLKKSGRKSEAAKLEAESAQNSQNTKKENDARI
jgi:tetratricopeptide (TPR) repeat protein